MLEVRPRVSAAEIKRQIEAALKRSAEFDANRITVETQGDKVILRGTVRSAFEREEAERAAWAAPGVREVDIGSHRDWHSRGLTSDHTR